MSVGFRGMIGLGGILLRSMGVGVAVAVGFCGGGDISC